MVTGTLRRFSAVVAGLAVLLQSACYTFVPTGGVVPAVGTRIALRINDAGRLALGGSMGPEIDQVEGMLQKKDSVEFVLAVRSVHTIRGGDQAWSGEQVRVKAAYVTGVSERKLSKSRTIVASAVSVGLLVYLVRMSLNGSGTFDPKLPPVDTAHTSLRKP